MNVQSVLYFPFVCVALVLSSPLAAEEPKVRSTLQGHTKAVVCVVFSPDGKTLATASADDTVKLWDMTTGQERATLKGYAGFAGGVSFSPDGKTLASACHDSTLKLWEVSTGKERATLKGHRGCIGPVAFSADGNTLASALMGSPIASEDNYTVKLWDVPTAKKRAILEHGSFVVFLAFAPVGKTLASVGKDHTIKLWRVGAGTERATFPGRACAFSPDGKTLAAADEDSIKLWELATDKERATLPKQAKKVLSVAFSPDGRTLASATQDGTVKLWDSATGKERFSFQGHTKEILSVTFSADGKTLATASEDHTVKLWDIPSLKAADSSGAGKLAPEELESLWARLAGEDAAKAYEAEGTLIAAPDQGILLIRKRLRPAVEPKAEHITPWITDLESDQFAVRQKATVELEKLGEQAAGFLRQKLADKPPLEVSQRIEQLLGKIEQEQLPPESLRAVRAVEVLECLGNPEARAVLETLAKGARGFRLTTEAKAAMERLDRRESANK